jgi:hypothetical protein
MTSLNGRSEVLKQDACGRVRTPEQRRQVLLEEFEKSGLSGAKFARLAGIKYATFMGWTTKRREERKAVAVIPSAGTPARNGGGPVRLVEAVVDNAPVRESRPALPAPAEVGLLIELPGGGRMRVESPVQLRMAAELLAMLAQAGCGRC